MILLFCFVPAAHHVLPVPISCRVIPATLTKMSARPPLVVTGYGRLSDLFQCGDEHAIITSSSVTDNGVDERGRTVAQGRLTARKPCYVRPVSGPNPLCESLHQTGPGYFSSFLPQTNPPALSVTTGSLYLQPTHDRKTKVTSCLGSFLQRTKPPRRGLGN